MAVANQKFIHFNTFINYHGMLAVCSYETLFICKQGANFRFPFR